MVLSCKGSRVHVGSHIKPVMLHGQTAPEIQLHPSSLQADREKADAERRAAQALKDAEEVCCLLFCACWSLCAFASQGQGLVSCLLRQGAVWSIQPLLPPVTTRM